MIVRMNGGDHWRGRPGARVQVPMTFDRERNRPLSWNAAITLCLPLQIANFTESWTFPWKTAAP